MVFRRTAWMAGSVGDRRLARRPLASESAACRTQRLDRLAILARGLSCADRAPGAAAVVCVPLVHLHVDELLDSYHPHHGGMAGCTRDCAGALQRKIWLGVGRGSCHRLRELSAAPG